MTKLACQTSCLGQALCSVRDPCLNEYSIERLRKTPENSLRHPQMYTHTGIFIPTGYQHPPTHTHKTKSALLFADCPCLPSQVKCEHYWPLDAQPCIHRQLQVTLISEEVSENWTVRHLQLFHVSLSNPTRTLQEVSLQCVSQRISY